MGNESATRTTTPTTAGGRSSPGANGAMVEPRTNSGAGVGDEELFLTPRVLDAGAFARYAETLKGIIAQASAQGRTLEDFSADAEAMIKRCGETSDSVNKRLQAGIRMLKMIDERAERTDQLLDRVQRALPDAQAMSERIDRVIDERLAASEQRIEALIAAAERRATAAERQAGDAIERTREHAAQLEALGQTIDERLSSLRELIERSESSRDAGIGAIREEVDEARAQINDAVARAFEKAHEASSALSTRADATLGEIESRVERVGHSIKPLIEASSKAMRALGMDPEHPVFEDSPLARIESLVDRGETQLASLDRVYRQLEDLQSQAESVRSAFGNWLLEAAGELDTLEERKATIVGPMQQAAERIRELGPDLEEKLELASTELSQLQFAQKTLRETIAASSQLAGEVTDRMSNQSGQLQALLDGSLHKLSTRVEQAGVWLGTLIQRAEALGASMPGAGTMSFDAGDAVPTHQTPRHETHTPEPSAPGSHHAQATPQRGPDESASWPTTGETGTRNPSEPDREASAAQTAHASPESVADADAFAAQGEAVRSYVVPRPPRLPIDGLSFDGADGVFTHGDDQDEDADEGGDQRS